MFNILIGIFDMYKILKTELTWTVSFEKSFNGMHTLEVLRQATTRLTIHRPLLLAPSFSFPFTFLLVILEL